LACPRVVDNTATSYTVGGVASLGTIVTNNGDDLMLTQDGPSPRVSQGSLLEIDLTRSQTCSVANGSGTWAARA
jgi:hypothetical protein